MVRYVVELTHGEDAWAGWMVGWDGWVVRWKWNRLDFPISNGSIGRHSHWSLVEGRSDSKTPKLLSQPVSPCFRGAIISPHWYTLMAFFQGAYPKSCIEYAIQVFLKNFLIHVIVFYAAGPFGLLCRLGVKWETPLGGRFFCWKELFQVHCGHRRGSVVRGSFWIA